MCINRQKEKITNTTLKINQMESFFIYTPTSLQKRSPIYITLFQVFFSPEEMIKNYMTIEMLIKIIREADCVKKEKEIFKERLCNIKKAIV